MIGGVVWGLVRVEVGTQMTSGRPTTNIVAVPRNLLLLFRFAYYSPITLCSITNLRSLTPTPLSNPPPSLNILYTFDYIGHIPLL